MDWKSYYSKELRKPGTRDKIVHWLRAANRTVGPSDANDPRTVFSFPHTALDEAGPLQARVVSWLIHGGFKRVIALGVIHGSLIPVYQIAANEAAPLRDRLDAYSQISGAYLPNTERLASPFGHLAVHTELINQPLEVKPDLADLLEREFSLDTFLATLRLATDAYDVNPLVVIPLYIAMTRNPVTKSFEGAEALAHWLLTQWDQETAIVTTGDVVHYGAVYGSETSDATPAQLESKLRRQLETLLDLAFREGKTESAYQMAQRELKSDQREILPLLMYLLGEAPVTTIETFALSNYAPILNTAPPCLVASALIAYKHGSIK